MNHRKIRSLQNVRRFNFEQCNRYQSVAEHSFFVALLVRDAAVWAGWSDVDVMVAMDAALMHDANEAVTGDFPYLVRKAMSPSELNRLESMAAAELNVPGMVKYPLIALDLVGFCDALELALYLQEERSSGNVIFNAILMETYARLLNHVMWLRLGNWTRDVLGVDEGDGEWISAIRHRPEFNGLKH